MLKRWVDAIGGEEKSPAKSSVGARFNINREQSQGG